MKSHYHCPHESLHRCTTIYFLTLSPPQFRADSYRLVVLNAGAGLKFHAPTSGTEDEKSLHDRIGMVAPLMEWRNLTVQEVTNVDLWAGLLELAHVEEVVRLKTYQEDGREKLPLDEKDYYAHLQRYLGGREGLFRTTCRPVFGAAQSGWF